MMVYSPDTIRILVSSDNHVGYAEHDPVRTDDGWRTFDEILEIAKTQDVDMVLLGGDLFHENHPSRKSMSEVVNSLSEHCQGNKPVALEIIGDQSEHFPGRANKVNYMNPNLNISIPVFSIHGNHDDPTGPEHKSALDVLHDAGLLNYYGRISRVDDIHVKPLLMQKGTTKLALYGISNVRDERLFQTFRNHGVTFYTPTQARDEWYSILTVHQNHTPHTDSSYLPESSLPSSMDMVIWGHEHECKIHPRLNDEMGFKVMQPGSSIATSLIPGEAVTKEIAILNITGQECKVQTIKLKSVRPFVYRDVILQKEKGMKELAMQPNNFAKVKKFCKAIIEEMITEANDTWLANNPQFNPELDVQPLPLIRLRVEYTAPEGGEYQVEQNQRFSQEYHDRVANTKDVINFHKRPKKSKRIVGHADDLDEDDLAELEEKEEIDVANYVNQYLGAQALTMLPREIFSDAVKQFVDKGDKKALDLFIADHLQLQIDGLIEKTAEYDSDDDDQMLQAMNAIREQQEKRFQEGTVKARTDPSRLLPKPDDYDSDAHGPWEESIFAYAPGTAHAENQDEAEDEVIDSDDASANGTRGGRGGRGSRGRGRGGRAKATTTIRKAATTKKTTAKKPAAKGKGKKKQPFEEDSSEEIMILDDDDDDNDEIEDSSAGLFVSQTSSVPARSAPSRSTATRAAATGRATQSLRQSALSFANTGPSSTARTNGVKKAAPAKAPPARRREPSEDEIDDDDDAFEPVSSSRRR